MPYVIAGLALFALAYVAQYQRGASGPLTEKEKSDLESIGVRPVRIVDIQNKAVDTHKLMPMTTQAKEKMHAIFGGSVVGVSRERWLAQNGVIFFEVMPS